MENIGTESGATQVDTTTEPIDTGQSTVDTQSSASTSPETEQTTTAYQPFREGKEKFKLDNEEVEWDWETTKKYASLGAAGYKRMEQAAAIRKQAEQAYSQLMHLAQTDPVGLLRTLNPKFNPQALQQRQETTESGNVDPRDLEIRELKQRYETVAQTLERQEIEREKSLMQQEFDASFKKYPILKANPFAMDRIRAEYTKALQAGIDVSIDEIAFLTAQELQKTSQAKTQVQQQRIQEKRKNAPVSVTPGSKADKPMTIDDVKRLAGMAGY